MHIVIDAREGFRTRRDGKGNYVRELIEALSRIDPKNTYILVVNDLIDDDRREFPRNFSYVNIPKKGALFFFELFQFLRKTPYDIFFSPTSYILPSVGVRNSVFTVHDLIVFRYPKMHSLRAKMIEQFAIKKACREGKAIISVSHHTKKDLVDMFPEVSSKVTVTHLAPVIHCENFQDKKSLDFQKKTLEKYNLTSKRYFLSIGTLDGRKNIRSVIKAFSIFSENRNLSQMKLVIAGERGTDYRNILSERGRSPFQKNIVLPGFVNEREKSILFQNSFAFLYPSFYEGFGLPVLEAMKCLVPVVASSSSSIPEIAKDGALFFHPKDHKKLSEWMMKLASNPLLVNELVIKGRRRADMFSWEKTAKITLDLFSRMKK